jgi:hypothetical protein
MKSSARATTKPFETGSVWLSPPSLLRFVLIFALSGTDLPLTSIICIASDFRIPVLWTRPQCTSTLIVQFSLSLSLLLFFSEFCVPTIYCVFSNPHPNPLVRVDSTLFFFVQTLVLFLSVFNPKAKYFDGFRVAFHSQLIGFSFCLSLRCRRRSAKQPKTRKQVSRWRLQAKRQALPRSCTPTQPPLLQVHRPVRWPSPITRTRIPPPPLCVARAMCPECRAERDLNRQTCRSVRLSLRRT